MVPTANNTSVTVPVTVTATELTTPPPQPPQLTQTSTDTTLTDVTSTGGTALNAGKSITFTLDTSEAVIAS
ncbi:MAG: hypothetical protein WA728_20910, partial [Xanthobacteraceae bacterium]